MSGLKLPKDTDEMQEDSSDNESVLEMSQYPYKELVFSIVL